MKPAVKKAKQEAQNPSDKEIRLINDHTVFTFRDDSDLTNRQLLDGILECNYITKRLYDDALRCKGLMLKLVSAPAYYIKRRKELWDYLSGQSNVFPQRLDGKGPISRRYMQILMEFTPIGDWFSSVSIA